MCRFDCAADGHLLLRIRGVHYFGAATPGPVATGRTVVHENITFIRNIYIGICKIHATRKKRHEDLFQFLKQAKISPSDCTSGRGFHTKVSSGAS